MKATKRKISLYFPPCLQMNYSFNKILYYRSKELHVARLTFLMVHSATKKDKKNNRYSIRIRISGLALTTSVRLDFPCVFIVIP